ncbi:hypothetical protein [Spirosoma koreense]
MKQVIIMGAMLLSVAAFSAHAQTTAPSNGVNNAAPKNGVQGTIIDSSSTDSAATINSTPMKQSQTRRRGSMNSSGSVSDQSGTTSSGSTSQRTSRKMKRTQTSKETNPQ